MAEILMVDVEGSEPTCGTCGSARVIHTDRPGATSPRPCPACDPDGGRLMAERFEVMSAPATGAWGVWDHGSQSWVLDDNRQAFFLDRKVAIRHAESLAKQVADV